MVLPIRLIIPEEEVVLMATETDLGYMVAETILLADTAHQVET
jgi:hypothetical protein